MDKKTVLSIILSVLLTASVTIGVKAWDNKREEVKAEQAKAEALQAKNADQAIVIAKLEIGRETLLQEIETLKDENKSLRWQLRRAER